jgi:hypothetical protein
MPAAAATDEALVARLRRLPRVELTHMYEAAAEAVASARTLADEGANPVTAVLRGASIVEEWAHFPAGDVIDPKTHGQFYYHAHAADERAAGEHGHFHIFVRPKAIAPGAQPVATPDSTADEATWITHLVGISVDASGGLIRLFTTNRWVTGEVWYDAEAVIGMLDRFDMTGDAPSRALNRWISAIVHMFRPQIADLLHARDARVAAFQATHADSDVLEDRALQITSEMPADFLAQIRAIEAALDGPSAHDGARQSGTGAAQNALRG